MTVHWDCDARWEAVRLKPGQSLTLQAWTPAAPRGLHPPQSLSCVACVAGAGSACPLSISDPCSACHPAQTQSRFGSSKVASEIQTLSSSFTHDVFQQQQSWFEQLSWTYASSRLVRTRWQSPAPQCNRHACSIMLGHEIRKGLCNPHIGRSKPWHDISPDISQRVKTPCAAASAQVLLWLHAKPNQSFLSLPQTESIKHKTCNAMCGRTVHVRPGSS